MLTLVKDTVLITREEKSARRFQDFRNVLLAKYSVSLIQVSIF